MRILTSRPSGWAKELDAKRKHIKGREDGRRQSMGPGVPDPIHIYCSLIWLYAILAFLAIVRGGAEFSLLVGFRVVCVFSFAANSSLTFVVIAATSTL